jgi:hypothetical protein
MFFTAVFTQLLVSRILGIPPFRMTGKFSNFKPHPTGQKCPDAQKTQISGAAIHEFSAKREYLMAKSNGLVRDL